MTVRGEVARYGHRALAPAACLCRLRTFNVAFAPAHQGCTRSALDIAGLPLGSHPCRMPPCFHAGDTSLTPIAYLTGGHCPTMTTTAAATPLPTKLSPILQTVLLLCCCMVLSQCGRVLPAPSACAVLVAEVLLALRHGTVNWDRGKSAVLGTATVAVPCPYLPAGILIPYYSMTGTHCHAWVHTPYSTLSAPTFILFCD